MASQTMEAGTSVQYRQNAPASCAPQGGLSTLLAWGGFGVAALFFLMLKSFCFHWQVSDENIYYYMAWAILDHGALPYRDFFFAHPPLHLLPGVAVFGLLGFGPLTARIIPVAATLVGATFLFLLAKQQLGRLAAVVTVALYLNSLEVLGDSTHWTGVNLAVMWLVMGLWALFRQRHGTAGVMLALGVGTGNYVLPAATMAGLLAFLERREAGARYLFGFGVVWLVIQGGGVLLGGWNYIDGVYRFHFIKPAMGAGPLGMFVQVVTDNSSLWLGTVLALVLAEMDNVLCRVNDHAEPLPSTSEGPRRGAATRLWSRFRHDLLDDGPPGVARIAALWVLGYSLFISTLPTVFPFYFLPMFPGLALAAGFAVERFIHHALGLVRSAGRRNIEWWEAARILGMVTLAAGVGYALRVPVQRSLLPTYARARDTPMKWSDAPLPINSLLRWCCWDDVARAYTSYGTLQEALYHESRYFEQAEVLADYVRRNSRPDQVLFGDSSTAGLVALLAGRRLAADCADTNIMRFSSGLAAPGQVIEQIDTPDLAFVLVQARPAPGSNGTVKLDYAGFAALPAFQRWLDEDFEIVFRADDRTKGTFLLLSRRP